MKKKIKIIILAIMTLLSVFVFYSCSDDSKTVQCVCACCPDDGYENCGEMPDFICGTQDGSYCGVLALNVFDENKNPVAGARVFINDIYIGSTGNVDYATIGYMKKFLKPGDYLVYAENENATKNGLVYVSVPPLGIVNADIIFGKEIHVPPSNEIDEDEVITCRYDSNQSADNCIDYLMADGWDTDSVTAHCSPMANTASQVLSITTGDSCLTERGQTGDNFRCFAPEVCGTYPTASACPDAFNYYGYLPNGYESICDMFMLGEIQTAPFGEHYIGESDPCDGISCGPNGTCSEGACECDVGWTGDECETDIDDCASDPCQNGGTCTDGVNSYICDCASGFSGDNCETQDPCYGINCGDHGSCADGACVCTGGYSGDSCEIPPAVDPCEGVNCGDHGSCVDGSCVCVAGYTGDLCESTIDENVITCRYNSSQSEGNCIDYPIIDGWTIADVETHCNANANHPSNPDVQIVTGSSCLMEFADAGGAIDRCYAPELCGPPYPKSYPCNDVSDDHNALYYYGYLLDGYQFICSEFMQGEYQDGPFALVPYELP